MSTDLIAYIGAYTQKLSFVEGKAEGISVFKFTTESQRLMQVETITVGANPTFLALSPNQNFLYIVNEVPQGSGPNGWVTAFSIDASNGKLSYLNRQSTQGFSPCHLCLAGDGRFVIAANYESGNICLLPRLENGHLEPACDVVTFSGYGPHPRQEGPHAHMVTPSPNGRFILGLDLGSDQIWIFKLDAQKGKLQPTNPPTMKLSSGSGPRHIAFHPNGRFCYVIGELDSSVTLLHYDCEQSTFLPIETHSTLPDDFQGQNTGAEIQVARSGKYVYASNRGHNSLAIFAVNNANGQLSLLGHQPTFGKTPRHFTIDRSGNYLIAANQDSDSLAVFKINHNNGFLDLAGPLVNSPTPVCVKLA